jgi:hypothetical protein
LKQRQDIIGHSEKQLIRRDGDMPEQTERSPRQSGRRRLRTPALPQTARRQQVSRELADRLPEFVEPIAPLLAEPTEKRPAQVVLGNHNHATKGIDGRDRFPMRGDMSTRGGGLSRHDTAFL